MLFRLGISDHSLIYAVRKFAVPKTRPTIKEVRNFKHFVEVDFINELNRVSWQNVECFDDPNLAWQAWKSDFNAIQMCGNWSDNMDKGKLTGIVYLIFVRPSTRLIVRFY